MRIRIVGLLALAMILAACQDDDPDPTSPSPAQQEDLFTLVAEPALSSVQEGYLSHILSRPSSAEVHMARLADTPAQFLRHGGVVRVRLAPDRQVVAIGEKVEQRGANDLSWSGELRDEYGSVQLALMDLDMTASVHAGGTLYKVWPLSGGMHAIVRIDRSRLPPEHSPGDSTGAP